MKESLVNLYSGHSRLIKALLFVLLFVLIFSAFYISRINIYDDFKIEVWDDNHNISNQTEIYGVSTFNRIILLEKYDDYWYNETWFFNKLIIVTDNINTTELRLLIRDSNNDLLNELNVSLFENEIVLDRVYKKKNYARIITNILPFSVINSLRFCAYFSIFVLVIFFAIFKDRINRQEFLIIINLLRYLILVLLLISGIILRFNNSLTTILAYDYKGHLYPAILFLIEGELFRHWWSYPYALFSVIILSVFKDINLITIIQHSLATISVIALIIYLEYWQKQFLKHAIFNLFFTLILIVFMDFVFLHGELISYEKMFHHEGLLIFSAVTITLCILLYFNNIESKYRFIYFIIVIPVLFLMMLMHYRMLAGLLFTVFYILYTEISERKNKSILNRYILPIIIFIIHMN